MIFHEHALLGIGRESLNHEHRGQDHACVDPANRAAATWAARARRLIQIPPAEFSTRSTSAPAAAPTHPLLATKTPVFFCKALRATDSAAGEPRGP